MYDPVINWPGNFKLSKFLSLFYTETGYSCPWIWTTISGFIWISFSNLYKSESNKYCLILYHLLRIHCSMLINSLKNDDDFYCFLKKKTFLHFHLTALKGLDIILIVRDSEEQMNSHKIHNILCYNSITILQCGVDISTTHFFFLIELFVSSLFIFATNGTVEEFSCQKFCGWSIKLFVQTAKRIIRCFGGCEYKGAITY